MTSPPAANSLRHPAIDPAQWLLDPSVIFLNHGSFGSCPRVVLEFQGRLRERLERQPLRFLLREFEGLWDDTRAAVAEFVGAESEDIVFVPNATTGVNTVLRSLRFQPGDELLVTNQEYNACRNALDLVASQAGARVVVADVPFPLRFEDQVAAAILERVSSRTRLLLCDHVTSQTGLVLPIRRIVHEMTARGIDTLVDGSHAPGMVPLNLHEIGAAYYTGNCHKWMCAPKSCAFLHVARCRQELVRPLTISHGANSRRTDRSRFLIEFGWMGTSDPTACFSVREAIRFMGSLLSGGWPEIIRRNRELALAARNILCAALRIESPCPDSMIGSLVSVPLPDSPPFPKPEPPLYLDSLQDRLLIEHGIEVPVIPWPAPPKRLLRVSAQLYNSLPQYESLARAIEVNH